MKHLKTQHGFTLLEIIMVLVISGIIIVGSSSILLQGFKSYKLAKEVMANTLQAQIAIDKITRDLHEISDIKKISLHSLVVYTTNGEKVEYIVDNNYLKRNSNKLNGIIADNIKNVTFKYYDIDGKNLYLDPNVDPKNYTPLINKIAYINVYIESTSIILSTTTYLWNLW